VNVDEHRWMREQLGAFTLKQLDPRERIAVQAHLDGCRPCRGELASLTPLAEVLRRADPERLQVAPAPPPDFGSQVLNRVRFEQARKTRRSPRWASTVVTAAVVGVVGVGTGWWMNRAEEVPLEPVAFTTAAPQLKAAANVVPHTWGMEIRLQGTGFTDGQVYKVNVMDESGHATSAGEFIGVGQTEMNCNFVSSVTRQKASSFEVRDPQGTVILKSTLP
jgi:hypothetical protein